MQIIVPPAWGFELEPAPGRVWSGLLRVWSPEMFTEMLMTGIGFGLESAVNLDPSATKVFSSVGEFAWGGAASTAFSIDPKEELTAMLLTQLMPPRDLT
ncbi:MAG: hypothetical protein JO100_04230 [Pseudonocardia sp.]|nr:hypothetical protein [Pseudonocardia sp.]